MIETLGLMLARIDPIWIAIGGFIGACILILIIREINAWFWKINSLIETQESILSTLEDIRDSLSAGSEEEQVVKKKETFNEMLEKKPKRTKGQKENPPK